MYTKVVNIIKTVIFAAFLLILSAFCFLGADKEVSEAENRPLKQMPELSFATVKNGEFMGGFEDYALDQFPFRQGFRKLKALNSQYILRLGDNNGFYKKDGVIAEITYPLNTESVSYATEKFNFIYDKYIDGKNMNVYMSVVPDKNELLGGMKIDKDQLFSQLQSEFGEPEMIDIYDMLSADNYYVTDHHWKQEALVEVAAHIAESMGTSIPTEGYTTQLLTDSFYGEYYEQALLPADADKIFALHNDTIDSFSVFVDGEESVVYNKDKASGKSPYDAYLSGAMTGVVQIMNPNADNDKVLYVFRDSFGSSIGPLLAQGYSQTVLIDIRVNPSMLAGFQLRDPNADVLFLYSTLVLNDSSQMK